MEKMEGKATSLKAGEATIREQMVSIMHLVANGEYIIFGAVDGTVQLYENVFNQDLEFTKGFITALQENEDINIHYAQHAQYVDAVYCEAFRDKMKGDEIFFQP